jgi:hypothetical protein
MHLCDREEHDLTRGVTGSRKTSSIAGHEPSTFDTTADYIKEPLGGYGLYYRSVLAGLGLVYPGGPRLPYPVDVPTEKGKEGSPSRRAVEAALVAPRRGPHVAPVKTPELRTRCQPCSSRSSSSRHWRAPSSWPAARADLPVTCPKPCPNLGKSNLRQPNLRLENTCKSAPT